MRRGNLSMLSRVSYLLSRLCRKYILANTPVCTEGMARLGFTCRRPTERCRFVLAEMTSNWRCGSSGRTIAIGLPVGSFLASRTVEARVLVLPAAFKDYLALDSCKSSGAHAVHSIHVCFASPWQMLVNRMKPEVSRSHETRTSVGAFQSTFSGHAVDEQMICWPNFLKLWCFKIGKMSIKPETKTSAKRTASPKLEPAKTTFSSKLLFHIH